jgi:hypothetical protein
VAGRFATWLMLKFRFRFRRDTAPLRGQRRQSPRLCRGMRYSRRFALGFRGVWLGRRGRGAAWTSPCDNARVSTGQGHSGYVRSRTGGLGTQQFSPDAEARWRAFRGEITDSDRLDLPCRRRD